MNNQSINLAMVQEGQAVVYSQYLTGCKDTKDKFLDAESKRKAKN
ncbi:MAG: thermonuclease family protein [Dolichospermum lemmermannii FEM_B0920]